MKLFVIGEVSLQKAVMAIGIAVTTTCSLAQNVDADAAYSLARKNNCTKCHAIDKAKKAPPFARIGSRYRGNPDAEAILLRHISGNPTVKIDDGNELHEPPTTKDPAELSNLVRWILSVAEK